MSIPHIYNPPVHQGLNIVYEDDSLLIVNKPAGLLTVPGKGDDKQDSLISRVQLEYPGALIVHRLDMATSGLLMLALNKEMQGILGNMFQNKQISKTYVAVVSGHVDDERGSIDLPLITDWPNRPKQMIDHERGKPSVTHYKVLSHKPDNTTSVELTPVTGRTHQLRVHMQSLGHPIIGDRLYSSELTYNERLLLHATYLEFSHPETSKIIRVHQPADFHL